jgi:hypothetical protein
MAQEREGEGKQAGPVDFQAAGCTGGKLSFSFFSICFQNLLNRVSNPNQIK